MDFYTTIVMTERSVNNMCAKIIDKQEKKNQIVLAAIETFVLKGFEKTTINEIAQAAGIGKGTIYEYFKSKEEVIHFAFKYFMNVMAIDFEQILLAEISARDKLEQILRAVADFVNPVTEPFLRLMFNFWGEAMRATDSKNLFLNDLHKYYISYKSIFADIIIEGMGDGSFKKNINPEAFAGIIVGMLDGLMVQWILHKEGIDIQETMATLISTIFRGILNE